MSEDFYKILGVEKDASIDDIKKQYRKLAMEYHPDKQQGKSEAEKKEAEEKFKKISEAYDTLSNPEKREQYDLGGGGSFRGFQEGENFNMRDFFRNHAPFFDTFSDFDSSGSSAFFGDFGSFGHSNSFSPCSPRNGRDVQIKIEVPLKTVIFGDKKSLDIDFEDYCSMCKGTGAKDGKIEECPTCHGSGFMFEELQQNEFTFIRRQVPCHNCQGKGFFIETECSHCHGSGRERVRKHLEFKIPIGITEKEKLRISGKGESGFNGGKPGDFYVSVIPIDDEIFSRDHNDNDLYSKTYINPLVGLAGGLIDVLTPYGVQKIKIDSWLKNGKPRVLKLRNFGIRKNGEENNLYTTLVLDSFENVSPENRAAINAILEKLKNNPLVNSKKQEEYFKSTYS